MEDQTNKEIENSQKDIKSGYLGEEGDDVLIYTTNQTNNRIREEFLEWCKEDPALELANGVGSFENIADWFLPKIDELLKSQRDGLVGKIKELPAFTSISDKCMGKVSDEAKKPRWGTNYLERETVLNLLSNLSPNKENKNK